MAIATEPMPTLQGLFKEACNILILLRQTEENLKTITNTLKILPSEEKPASDLQSPAEHSPKGGVIDAYHQLFLEMYSIANLIHSRVEFVRALI